MAQVRSLIKKKKRGGCKGRRARRLAVQAPRKPDESPGGGSRKGTICPVKAGPKKGKRAVVTFPSTGMKGRKVKPEFGNKGGIHY